MRFEKSSGILEEIIEQVDESFIRSVQLAIDRPRILGRKECLVNGRKTKSDPRGLIGLQGLLLWLDATCSKYLSSKSVTKTIGERTRWWGLQEQAGLSTFV